METTHANIKSSWISFALVVAREHLAKVSMGKEGPHDLSAVCNGPSRWACVRVCAFCSQTCSIFQRSCPSVKLVFKLTVCRLLLIGSWDLCTLRWPEPYGGCRRKRATKPSFAPCYSNICMLTQKVKHVQWKCLQLPAQAIAAGLNVKETCWRWDAPNRCDVYHKWDVLVLF